MFPGISLRPQDKAVKRSTSILAIALLSGSIAAAPAADEAFATLAEQYVSDLSRISPVSATLIGDHSADHELDNVDARGRANSRRLYLEYRAALAAIDHESLSRANQVDAEILHNEVESSLWALDTFQSWAWNPLDYVNLSGSAIYGLVARDFAPLEQRFGDSASRLKQLPRFLRQARESIDPERVPKIHAEIAAQQNLGLVSIIDTMIVPRMDELTMGTRDRLTAAIEVAKDAIAAHQTWLEEELLPRAAGDFRVGAELFDAKLAFVLHSPLGRREVKARAEGEYESVRNQMYEIAKEVYTVSHPYTAFPDTPNEEYKQAIIRAALEQAYQQLPPRDGIVEVAKDFLQQATDKNLGIVTQFNVLVDAASDLDRVARAIDDEFAVAEHPTTTRSEKAFVAYAAADMVELVAFTRYLGWGCIAAVLTLVGNAIVLSVQDRVKDHAILQTLGYSPWLIGRLVLCEGIVVGLLGGGMGTLLAAGVIEWGQFSLSTDGLSIPIEATPLLLLTGMGISLALGVLAGVVPAWQATRCEIARCFRAV